VSDDARPVPGLDRIAFTRERRQFELLKVLPVGSLDLDSDSVHEPMIALREHRAYIGRMADQRLTAEQVRAALMGENARLLRRRSVFRRLPSPPRCKLCAVPFAGIGGLVLRHVGFPRSPGNPSLCSKCLGKLRKQGMNGVEMPVTLLFSDVRGSTALGEQMRPTDFHAFLEHFYRLASEAVIRHDGLVDKVVGDEVVALFFGGISGPNHAAAAVAAAIDVAERAAGLDATPSGPIPVGTAVHTGEAFVGGTGPGGTIEDFTALGDVVNTAARLAAEAGAGEVIVSTAAAEAVGLEGVGRRTLEIRGRAEPIEVVVVRPQQATR
jgi:adenylate cyclase